MKIGFKCLLTRQREPEGITSAEETPCWIRKGIKEVCSEDSGFQRSPSGRIILH